MVGTLRDAEEIAGVSVAVTLYLNLPQNSGYLEFGWQGQ